jgi:hypothetical protein
MALVELRVVATGIIIALLLTLLAGIHARFKHVQRIGRALAVMTTCGVMTGLIPHNALGKLELPMRIMFALIIRIGAAANSRHVTEAIPCRVAVNAVFLLKIKRAGRCRPARSCNSEI